MADKGTMVGVLIIAVFFAVFGIALDWYAGLPVLEQVVTQTRTIETETGETGFDFWIRLVDSDGTILYEGWNSEADRETLPARYHRRKVGA